MSENKQVSDLLKKVLDQLEHSEKKENQTDYEFIMTDLNEVTIEANFHHDFSKANVILNFKGNDECGFRDQQAVKLTPFQAIDLKNGLSAAIDHLAQQGRAYLKSKGVK